jgi:F-type H+-transporting ATPase subunit alpha
MAFNLDRERIGVILLDDPRELDAGDEVRRTHRVIDVPVGDALLGRVVNPAGEPLDGRGPIHSAHRLPIEREAAAVLARAPVSTPLHTGITVVDALVPIGLGQRELIVGDRQTGKTSIAIDTILNQRGRDVSCIYCAIGQRSSATANVIAELKNAGAMSYCCVVATTGEDLAGMQFIAPYAATTIAESFTAAGRDALIVYDDLTRHARAYRELSLLLRRPPGREAYPGDIFYIHSRLLERATHHREGGTLTALPIIETQEENISAYIPTNLISITDGQIYLSPRLFREGILPAIDVGRSVSRIGGDAQFPAYKAVSGDLRITYSQFQELERFSRYGTRLDPERHASLEHGRRIREALKQEQGDLMSPIEQIAVLFAATENLFESIPIKEVAAAEKAVREAACKHLDEIAVAIEDGGELGDDDLERMRRVLSDAIGISGDEKQDEKHADA